MELTKELVAKAKEAKTPEELMALAKENGMELTEEETKAYFDRLHPQTGELSDWLGATRITATGKVVKRSYENDGWYYTLKIHDGSEIKMSESHVIKC